MFNHPNQTNSMWMFTKHGFFSIVLSSANPKNVAIRARAVKDLEALREAFPQILDEEIILTPDRDYYARILIATTDLPELMAQLGEDIDYPDFKSELKRSHTQDDKLPLLNELWRTMNDYQHQQHPGKGLYNSFKRKPAAPAPKKGRGKKVQPEEDNY